MNDQELQETTADILAAMNAEASKPEGGNLAEAVARAFQEGRIRNVSGNLQAQLRLSEESLTIAARRIVRLEQGLVDVIAHHVRLNQQQGRPTSHSRTIKIAQGALEGAPAEHLGMRVTGVTVQPEGELPRRIGDGVLVPGMAAAEGTFGLQEAEPQPEPVAWVCPTAGCGHTMTHAEHLVARMDNPCPGCGQRLSEYQPVTF